MKRLFLPAIAVVTVLGLAAPAAATGLLIPTERGIQPLAIKYHRAQVKIKDRVAVTHVEQVFVNHTNRDLEATYIFPLPPGATVSDFYLYVNGKRTKGEILEKNRARNIYEGIVRRMRDPGLIEYLGRDLFKCRVYPVPRRGEQKLEIEFTQMMPFSGGLMKYSYPMRTDRASARTLQDFTMSLQIASKVPIKAIYSPSHKIYHRKRDDHHAVAGFEKAAAVLDRDFELIITVSEKDVGLNLLTHRQPGEPGFFLLMASPKSEWRDREIMGKRITFVIDTSGSMSGPKMRHAKQALKYCLKRLNSDDLFNVVRFSTDVEGFVKKPVSAGKANVQRALNFVERIEAAGGTAIDEALTTALAGHVNQGEPNLVVFLTDGHPTVGETTPARIIEHVAAANAVGTKVFVFGVGAEINTHLLDRISGDNAGSSTYVEPGQQIERELATFYDQVSHPVLTDLQLDFGKIHEYDVLPKRIPDLFKGSQVIVLGRYRNQGHTALTLSGRSGEARKKFVFEGHFKAKNAANDFIPRLWATRKIGYLLDNIRLGGERKELVDEVVRLSKRYGIVTPYTSYLVTEDSPRVAVRQPRPDRPRRRGPLSAPHRPSGRRARVHPPAHAVQPSGSARGGGLRGLDDLDSAADGAAAPGPALQQHRSAAPPPAARPHRRSRRRSDALAGGRARGRMQQQSGQAAVDVATAVKELKKADRSEDEAAAGIRYIAGRAFRYRDGVWVDSRYDPDEMKLLELRYLGQAHFWLIQQSALLKQLFSLGERVIAVVGPKRAVQIGPAGRDAVPEAELRRYLP